MPQAIVTLPDGRKARVSFDTPEQLDAAVTDLNKGPQFGKLDPTTGRIRGVGDIIEEAVGEPALHIASGMVGSAVGGIAGLARGAGAAAGALSQGEGLRGARDAFVQEGGQTVENVQQALTLQPRTKIGKAVSGAIAVPFTLLQKGSRYLGEKTQDVTGSAELATLVDTGIQAAAGAALPPALRAGGRALKRATQGSAAAAEMSASGAPRQAPAEVGETAPRGTSSRGTSPPNLPPEMSATGAARQPPSQVGEPVTAPQAAPAPDLTTTGAPRQAPSQVGEGPAPETRSTPPPTPEGRARAYADRIGLDWAALGAGTRKALTTIAQDATALERLNPAAVKRQAALGGLRVPVQATRGQLERDPVQLRREAIASNTTEGQPIRDVDIAANRDLQANLEVLRGRAGGLRGGLHDPLTEEGEPAATPSIRRETKTPTQVGQAAQEAARGKAKWSRKVVEGLYRKARETEPDAKAGLKPITDLLTENPDIQHLGWVQSWLNKARSVLPRDEAGNLPELKEVTLNELDDLRKLANKNIKAGGTAGHYASQLKEAIDTAMQDVPEGAAAWKKATDAFRKHQEEFKDQTAVRNLVGTKKGASDRQLALEKTWNKVATGSLEQLRQVKRTLLTGGTAATRTAGRAAWRDIRAETVNRILEDARNVTAADETERAILTEAALRRSIKRIPRENLIEILGRSNVRELDAILRARRITTRSPVGGRTTQSGTVPNALSLFERVLKHIPGGKYAVGGKKLLKQVGELGQLGKTVERATTSPLEETAREVERLQAARARRAAVETLESGGQTLPGGAAPQPLPIGEALKQREKPRER